MCEYAHRGQNQKLEHFLKASFLDTESKDDSSFWGALLNINEMCPNLVDFNK